jgi:hypothetical protein
MIPRNCVPVHTWAPGASWPRVRVEEYLFSACSPSSLRDPSGNDLKLMYLGSRPPERDIESSIFDDGQIKIKKVQGRMTSVYKMSIVKRSRRALLYIQEAYMQHNFAATT